MSKKSQQTVDLSEGLSYKENGRTYLGFAAYTAALALAVCQAVRAASNSMFDAMFADFADMDDEAYDSIFGSDDSQQVATKGYGVIIAQKDNELAEVFICEETQDGVTSLLQLYKDRGWKDVTFLALEPSDGLLDRENLVTGEETPLSGDPDEVTLQEATANL